MPIHPYFETITIRELFDTEISNDSIDINNLRNEFGSTLLHVATLHGKEATAAKLATTCPAR